MNVRTQNDVSYFITLIVDFTYFCHIYLIFRKSALKYFRLYAYEIEKQLNVLRFLGLTLGMNISLNRFRSTVQGIVRKMTLDESAPIFSKSTQIQPPAL